MLEFLSRKRWLDFNFNLYFSLKFLNLYLIVNPTRSFLYQIHELWGVSLFDDDLPRVKFTFLKRPAYLLLNDSAIRRDSWYLISYDSEVLRVNVQDFSQLLLVQIQDLCFRMHSDCINRVKYPVLDQAKVTEDVSFAKEY